jgi:hypothetical protein
MMNQNWNEEDANYRELLLEDGDYDMLYRFDIDTDFMYCPNTQLPF